MAILPAIFAALIASAHCMPPIIIPPSLDATTATKRPTAWSFMLSSGNFSSANPQPLLLPDGRYKWPVHTMIFKNLLKNLADAQTPLMDAGKRFCALPPHAYIAANNSASKWHTVLEEFNMFKGKKLVKSQYLDNHQVGLQIPQLSKAPVQERIFEITMDTILLVGALYDSSGFDRIPAYLHDAPWKTVTDFMDLLTFEFAHTILIRWQDEDI